MSDEMSWTQKGKMGDNNNIWKYSQFNHLQQTLAGLGEGRINNIIFTSVQAFHETDGELPGQKIIPSLPLNQQSNHGSFYAKYCKLQTHKSDTSYLVQI